MSSDHVSVMARFVRQATEEIEELAAADASADSYQRWLRCRARLRNAVEQLTNEMERHVARCAVDAEQLKQTKARMVR